MWELQGAQSVLAQEGLFCLSWALVSGAWLERSREVDIAPARVQRAGKDLPLTLPATLAPCVRGTAAPQPVRARGAR